MGQIVSCEQDSHDSIPPEVGSACLEHSAKVEDIESILACMRCDGDPRKVRIRDDQDMRATTPRYSSPSPKARKPVLHQASPPNNNARSPAEHEDYIYMPYGGEITGSYWRSPTHKFDAIRTENSVVFDQLNKGAQFNLSTVPPSSFFDDFEAVDISTDIVKKNRFDRRHSKSPRRQGNENEPKTPRSISSPENTPRSYNSTSSNFQAIEENQESLAAMLLAPELGPEECSETDFYGGWSTGGPTHPKGTGLQEVFRRQTGRVAAEFEKRKNSKNFSADKTEYEVAIRRHAQITAFRHNLRKERAGLKGTGWAEGLVVATTRGNRNCYGRTESGGLEYRDVFVECAMENTLSYDEYKYAAMQAKAKEEMRSSPTMQSPRRNDPSGTLNRSPQVTPRKTY